MDARPTVGAPDDDPYLWLEDIESERALAWVEAQNSRTLARFGHAEFAADRDMLAAIYDRRDNIPNIERWGRHVYNLWRDAHNKRGLWRRTTLSEYRAGTPQPDWDNILDLDDLARKENEDWHWDGADSLPERHDFAMVRLSRGGGDAVVIREFDLVQTKFVAEGLVLPEAKGRVEWLDPDHLLVSSTACSGLQTRAGYARTVRLWRRNESLAHAPMLMICADTSNSVYTHVDRRMEIAGSENEQVFYFENLSFFDVRVWVGGRTGPKHVLDLPIDISVEIQNGWLAIKRRSPWTIEGKTFPADTVLGISLRRLLAGDRNFSVLFKPAARRVLKNFFWRGTFLVIGILNDLEPIFELLQPSEAGWSHSNLEGLPRQGDVTVWSLDAQRSEGSGELLASSEDAITPPRLWLIERGKSPAVLRNAPRTFASDGITMSRHEATSSDGERIPYIQTGPKDETGTSPVHLYGYGGFGLTVLPTYDSALGKVWIERGGTAVVAQIRGGGEFGVPWHEKARRAGRRLAYDDFAAVARDLVRRGVTQPKKIAAAGISNGGLLIINMMVRYPELFGALLSTVPLADMRRYHKLLTGASWIAEYGDPDIPEDWEFLREISPYHTAVPGVAYPPIMLATHRKDDRVHPGHARKMAAKLQAMGYECYFYEPASGGHGYGADNFQRAQFTALGYSFLRERIG